MNRMANARQYPLHATETNTSMDTQKHSFENTHTHTHTHRCLPSHAGDKFTDQFSKLLNIAKLGANTVGLAVGSIPQ